MPEFLMLHFGGMGTLVSGENSSRIVRFGVFEVDLKAGELRRSGLKVRVQEQPLQVLAVLLDTPEKW
jgi:DNA-binding winged helix-turn-helix (wHTH) protein